MAAPAGGSFYIYSFDGRLLAEYNLYGDCVRDYIYMGGRLVAEYRPSTLQYYYYMSDQINSTRMVTDDSGAVVYSAAYDPYGGVQQTWLNSFDPTLKFSGKERDGESGLDYFGARYYDRSQYRFISPDPTKNVVACCLNPQAWHYYSYWAYLEFGDIEEAGRSSPIGRVVGSYRSANRVERQAGHTYASKELYSTPNLANQSGDPNKPGLAYEMDLRDEYQSKLKELGSTLTLIACLFDLDLDIHRLAKKALWYYCAWEDMVMASNDVVYLSGRSNYKETNSFMDLFLFASNDFPTVPASKDY